VKVTKTEDQWRRQLTPDQFTVLRQGQTEVPFTGALLYNDKIGQYRCAACGQLIFDSQTKFDGHCGWPSFYNVANNQAVRLIEDNSHGMHRIEVRCANCDSHLGHVFNDAPDQPTGLRFCINSAALDFKPSQA
jgi:peptide-methionine (R)-S-oxide reductase